MYGALENREADYVSVTLALRVAEVDTLIEALQQLQGGEVDHFHLRCNDFSAPHGIGDIEVSLAGPSDVHNMGIK